MHPLELTILRQLFADKSFAERVTPYLKEEYFTTDAACIFKLFTAFYHKFLVVPQFAAIRIGLDNVPHLNETQAKSAQEALANIEATEPLQDDQKPWLLQETEEFCQERAVYVALQGAIRVMDDPKATRHAIPDMLKEALGVSFDTHVGHNYFDDAEARYDFYHNPEARIPFDLEALNSMTKGGVPKKTLNVVMAGTNVGKSLFLVHVAAGYVRMGKSVLYITCEMSEENTAQRVDANMMNLPMDDVEMLPRADYMRRVAHLRSTSVGQLVVKEYPTGTAHAGHFRVLLQELALKKGFKPDVVIVDYMTICASSKIKLGSAVNTNTLYKNVAEELRALFTEFDVPGWTATQFNRTGASSSDPNITDIGESWAIAQTADFMFALVQTEELEKLGQMMLIPMKNRYQKKNSFAHQLLGVDTPRMKIYDLTSAQQAAAVNAPPPGVTLPSNGNPNPKAFGIRRRQPFTSLKRDAGAED